MKPIILLLLACSIPSYSAIILLGSDYLTTVPGTFLQIPMIGDIPLMGVPIGPGNTDTIVQRQTDANLPGDGSSAMVPIELVALSLMSVAPVDLGGGSFFDIFITLDGTMPSTGQMTIHRIGNDPTPPGGTFDSFFDVFIQIEFRPVVAGMSVFQNSMLQLQSMGTPWSSQPPPGTVLVPGAPGNQNANLHNPLGPMQFDFFPIGIIQEIHPGNGGAHFAELATPEPGSGVLLGIGAALLWIGRRSRRRRSDPGRS